MSELDARIAKLLKADVPSARDAMFRLKVLELRERRRFQRQWLAMLAGLLTILAVLAVSIVVGTVDSTGGLAVSAALSAGSLAFQGRLMRTLRRFTI